MKAHPKQKANKTIVFVDNPKLLLLPYIPSPLKPFVAATSKY